MFYKNIVNFIFKSIAAFCSKNPALLFSSLILIGYGFANFAYVYFCPHPPFKTEEGTFNFHITKISQSKSFIRSSYIYEGKVGAYHCSLKFPINKERPKANSDYKITGKLYQRGKKIFLKPESKSAWIKIANTYSLAEYRYNLKTRFIQYLKSKMPSKQSYSLLAGLFTGEFDDPLLFWSFNNVGLSHLLCISGFHFALIAYFLHLMLRFLISPKLLALTLFFILTLYFLFIGPNPAVERSWIMTSIYFFGQLFELKPRGINSVGVALLISFFHPECLQSLGFQFSYGATFAILLFYPLIKNFYPKTSISKLLTKSKTQQFVTVLKTFFREALFLSLAVNILVIPLSLYHFHKFPILGIFYNLIYPLLISISLGLLLFSLLFHFIPCIENSLHSLNGMYSDLLLQGIQHPPPIAPFYVEHFSFPLLIFILSLSIFLGICAQHYFELRKRVYMPIFWI